MLSERGNYDRRNSADAKMVLGTSRIRVKQAFGESLKLPKVLI